MSLFIVQTVQKFRQAPRDALKKKELKKKEKINIIVSSRIFLM